MNKHKTSTIVFLQILHSVGWSANRHRKWYILLEKKITWTIEKMLWSLDNFLAVFLNFLTTTVNFQWPIPGWLEILPLRDRSQAGLSFHINYSSICNHGESGSLFLWKNQDFLPPLDYVIIIHPYYDSLFLFQQY